MRHSSNDCRDVAILQFLMWRPSIILACFNFNSRSSVEGQDASLCLILSKSVNPLQMYFDFLRQSVTILYF